MDTFPKMIRRPLGSMRRTMLSSFRRREYSFPDREPIVSFTFDDFPRSAFEIGGKILKSYGACGTYYAAIGLMGQTNKLGELFNGDDLRRLLAEGHELGSHSFSHLSCRSTCLKLFEADVQKGKEAVIEYTGGSKPHHFAYPHGHVTLRAKGRVGAQMNSCRGIFGGINISPIDLHLLRANHLFNGATDFGLIERLIRLNDRRSGWLIFYTHDIAETPSPYGCTPGQFEMVVRLAMRLRARILTINSAFEAFAANVPVYAGEDQV
jgi:peptidoglycan/xylan/chitin deacetylase (PgdA/CDA1 family)